MAGVTCRLPLEIQPPLERALVVGHCICCQQLACAGGAGDRARDSPCISWPPALYLHCSCSLPAASGPLLIAADPWQPGDSPWGAWLLLVVVRKLWWGLGDGSLASKGTQCWCGICKHQCRPPTTKPMFCKSNCPFW